MNILLPYEVWKSANMCISKRDVRKYLLGVRVLGSTICGTNGHYLYQCDFAGMSLPKGYSEATKTDESVTLRIKNKVPTSTKARPISFVSIDVDGNEFTAKYMSPSMDVEHIDIGVVIEGKYPDTKRVIDGMTDKPLQCDRAVGIHPQYLTLLQKISKGEASNFPVVKMYVRGSDTGIEFDLNRYLLRGCKERFIVMPCRID